MRSALLKSTLACTVGLGSIAFASLANAEVAWKVTGFVKAAAVGTDRSIGSFGQDNAVAPTSSRPNTLTGAASGSDSGLLTFQTQQSRIGITALMDETTKGVFEFDFVDFTESSPTVAMNPRVRIAKIEHRLSERSVIQAGQDWDIFSPLNTFTYNYVGNSFQAGNSAFMRQQLVYIHAHENFEMKYALGLVSANATASANDIERSSSPSLALSAAWGQAPSRLGVSVMGARSTVRPPTGRTDLDIYGLNLFAEQKWGSFEIRSEAYYGQNMNNAGMLTLGTGSATDDSVTEAGGFVSARAALDEKSNVFGTVGYAGLIDGTFATVSNAAPALGTALGGITQNFAAKLGFDRKLTDKLTVFGEASHFNTRWQNIGDGTTTMVEAGLFLFL